LYHTCHVSLGEEWLKTIADGSGGQSYGCGQM